MKRRHSFVVLAFGLLGLLAAGCDPGGPGVAGDVSLGASVSPAMFQTLIVRAVPDTGTAFDPAKPVFDVPPPAGETAWANTSAPLMGLTFPFPYSVGGGVGTTTQEKWRLFAWLSAGTDTAALGPKTGEPFGMTTFSVVSCEQFGDYCQTTEGVNVVIDKVAP